MPNASPDPSTRADDARLAISVRDLGKRYARETARGGLRWWRRAHTEDFWALKPLSFDVRAGEGLGVIGGNGAGKSTLLKILSRIVPPSTGEARLRGRLNSLLEVGTGFQRELSGRANIYLNASILGLSRAETAERFDEIVAFAGIGDFIDMPVSHYSSGMYSRLAFAIAAHVTGDILLVDEVLSVGDAEFRRRSMSKMEGLMRGESRTVLFVSHSMDAVLRFCDRAIWLDHGEMRAIGSADDVVREYLSSVSGGPMIVLPLVASAGAPAGVAHDAPASVAESASAAAANAPIEFVTIAPDGGISDTDTARIERIALLDPAGTARVAFFRDEPIHVFLTLRVTGPNVPIAGLVSVRCAPRKGVIDEVVVFSDCGPAELLDTGVHTISVLLPKHFFASGTYLLTLGLVTPGSPMLRHHLLKRVLSFQIAEREDDSEVLGTYLRGVVRPRLIWSRDASE